jgi:hypothetical protein
MKKLLLIVFLATSFADVYGQNSFEGLVILNVSDNERNQNSEVSLLFKGEKSRVEFGESNLVVLMNEDGIDFVVNGTVTQHYDKSQPTNSGSNIVGKLISEERKVSKQGYDCLVKTYKTGEATVAYWLSDKLGLGVKDLPEMLRANAPDFGVGLFPVRIEKRNGNGEIVRVQEVVSVEHQKIDDSKFKR